MKKANYLLYLLIPLLIALSLRLYPTLSTGMPFSTDGWPIIRNTELLIKNTPLPLNSGIFDDYNNFMPANSIFSSILSQVTSIAPINTMAIGIPLVGALAIPIFYVLTNRITKNPKVSLTASILLATAFPYTMFTAGVTKETFASPIYLALILIFLLKHTWKTTLLFSAVSFALVLSHQATTFLTIVILSILAVSLYVSRGNREQNFNTNKSNIMFIGILSTIAALYFGLYAAPALILTLTPNDMLNLGAYVIVITGALLYFVYQPIKTNPARTATKCVVSFLAPAIIIYLLTRVPVLPGAPLLPLHYFIYAMPFLIATPLMVLGLNDLHKNNFALVTPLFWLIAVLTLAIYSFFSNLPGASGFVYRFLNFMLPPMAILSALAFYKLYVAKPWHVQIGKISKLATTALIIIMLVSSTFTLFAAVTLQEPYLGYFWSYEPSEYAASNWVATSGNNMTISGDVKTQYLLDDYFRVNVNVMSGLTFIDGSGTAPNMLYIYNQMKTNGYVLYEGSPVSLPENWTNKLADFNIVFANDEVTLYAEP